jgi:DNA-binding transcriptional LysR family regulator
LSGTIDLNRLALFVAVAETGSFSTAAGRLRLPKSSVSRGVARLEESLGAQLLHRTTRHVATTSAGAALYERAAPLLGSLRAAVGVASSREEQPSGELRITAPSDIGQMFLAEIVARFIARFPAVTVDLNLTLRYVDLIAEGYDVAVRASGKPLKDSSLTARRLGGFEGHVYAAPSYLARRGMPKSGRELADHDWVVFRGMRGPLTLSGPGEPLVVQPRGRIVTDDFLVVREAIRAGAGVGLLDALYAEKDVAEGRLVCVLPRYRLLASGLYLVYPAARHQPRKVTAFRDFVLEWFNARVERPRR